ncbi:MAG: hypothetical protein GY829_15545 [Gammaproteobacteria bacterium]|nr:hypothetical protein [Gammaproteobacteria bacterium]
MKIELNKKYLITTVGRFVAPDGQQYKAVYGTVLSCGADIVIGSMTIASGHIHSCIRADIVSVIPKVFKENAATTRIYKTR